MPVPSTIADLSTTANSNSPASGEAVGPNLDNYLRAHAAIIKQESTDLADGTSATKGSFKVGYLPAGTGAVATTVQAKLREFVSVKDFGAVGDGVTDDTAAFTAALAASLNIYAPPGTYLLDGVTFAAGACVVGAGRERTILKVTNSVSASISLAGARIGFHHLSIRGTSARTELAFVTTASCTGLQFDDVLFFQLGKLLDVQHDFFWSRFSNFEIRDCDIGVESLIAQDLNAVSFVGGKFHHTAPTASTFPVIATDSDGISFIGVDVQNYGPKLDGCKGVVAHGGYWEAYAQPALTLIDTECDLNVFAPSATLWSIDDDSYKRASGKFPPTSEFPAPAPVSHTGKNIFPGPTCSTLAAKAIMGTLISGTSFAASINGSGHLQLDATASGSCAFLIPARVNGISALAQFAVLNGTWKVDFYSPTSGVEQANGHQHSDTDVHLVRMHSKVTDDNLCYFRVSTVGTVTGTFSIEFRDLYIVPDYVCIGRAPEDETAQRAIGGQFLSIDAGFVNINGGGGTGTLYTFGSTEFGTYLVSAYGANRGSAAQRAVAIVQVHSGSALTITSLQNTLLPLSSSGLALIGTNNGGGATDVHTEIVRLSS